MKQFEELTKSQQAHATKLGYHGFFADRDNVNDALTYANEMIATLPKHQQLHLTTAVAVLVNTYALSISQGELNDR